MHTATTTQATVTVRSFLLVKLACTALLLFAHGSALAQSTSSAELAEATLRARVANVQAILDERAGRAQLWQYGFMGLGYAVTGTFTALALTTHDSTQRLDHVFAAGGAFVDTTVHVLGSIEVHAAARVREQLDASPEQLRLKLAMAESQLAAVAEAERDRQTLLKSQVLPVGFSLATGLVLGIGFGHIRGAIVNTVAAIVVNEVRVLTQPTSTIEALERYRRNPDAPIAQRAPRSFAWSWAVAPTGCAIYGSF